MSTCYSCIKFLMNTDYSRAVCQVHCLEHCNKQLILGRKYGWAVRGTDSHISCFFFVFFSFLYYQVPKVIALTAKSNSPCYLCAMQIQYDPFCNQTQCRWHCLSEGVPSMWLTQVRESVGLTKTEKVCN